MKDCTCQKDWGKFEPTCSDYERCTAVKAPDGVQAVIDASEKRLVDAVAEALMLSEARLQYDAARRVARAVVWAYQREHRKIIADMAAGYGKKP